MTGIELLQEIRRLRKRLDRMKQEHQEEERYFQVLHSHSISCDCVSGGRVSTLDDILERQEEARQKHLDRYARTYLKYLNCCDCAWSLAAKLMKKNDPRGLGALMEYCLTGVSYQELGKRWDYDPSYIRHLVTIAKKQFITAYDKENGQWN